MIDKGAVGRRIAILRQGLGYSQAVFAEKLHVSAQAVSKWETGLALPDIEVLLNLSWVCKVSLHALLEGEDFVYPIPGLDRGMQRVSPLLVCPQCRKALATRIPGPGEICFSCGCGCIYDVADGVLHFGAREVTGELWSLWLRNYQHYLQEQRHPGNPRYWQGDPHYREVMWQHIKRLRPRTILVMACGTGSGIKYIIERINWPVTVIMADLSHRILKWNRVFFAEEWNNPYVDMVYMACDCAALPLADGCVDIVFSNGGFESMGTKMMPGVTEAHRVLAPGAHAVYNISLIENHANPDTQKWIHLAQLSTSGNLNDSAQWLAKCRLVGFEKTELTKIYDELPAPQDEIFPFENEVLQWMAEFIAVSQKYNA